MVVADKTNKNKNIEAIYPLSPMQQGILFHTLYVPESEAFFNQLNFTISGQLDIAAFASAWQKIVDRHSVLRTLFVWENIKQPLQVVRKEAKLPWNYLDWRSLSSQEQQEKLGEFLQADREQRFELNHAPLMRCTLIHLDDQTYQCIWSDHHLLLDGWCTSLILQEVFTFYESARKGETAYLSPPRPYRDYIVWLQQQDLSVAETFWRQTLKGFTAPTAVRVDRSEKIDSAVKEDYRKYSLQLSSSTTDTLQSLARQHHLTLSTFIQGAWAILLSRYSGESEVVFGSLVSGRPPSLSGVESMVGMFFNTLPVRLQVSGEDSLLSWLKKLQDQHIEIQQYSYSPLVEIQSWSEVPRGTALFDSVVVFQNYPVDAQLWEQNSGLQISNLNFFDQSDYPLTLIAAPGQNLYLQIDYYGSHFEDDTIRRMAGHLQTLLEAITAKPEQEISQLSLLSESERDQLLVEWNNTQVSYPQDKCLHQLIEEQVQLTPDAIAVVFEDQSLTYRELNERANQLAHYLKKLGVKSEELVGICLERSIEMVVGLLGILKAGAAYVPLDPAYPPERLTFMLSDSQVNVLLTQQELISQLPLTKAQVICCDHDWEKIAQEKEENSYADITAENLAYVIYTSGSTGQPKGAMNTHRGIVNRLLWMQDAYGLTTEDKVLQKTPFSFDVSVWEFFWTLLNGATLVVAQPGGHQDSHYLVNLIAQQQITTLHFVPSMLQIFLEERGIENCTSLKRVICSGEALPYDLQERFFESLDCELHNLYGPTEAAVDVSFWQCQPGHSLKKVPIGRPVANTQLYILDSDLNPVPIGVPGELHIGGVQLAKGYLNRPELTAEKFIPNPFSNDLNARLYKTGDLARYLKDGNIEYLGRLDHQVKLRGFRIELGEIEAVLCQHPSVKESLVLFKEDRRGDKHLVAYLTPSSEPLTSEQLRDFLKRKLPEYMVPSLFLWLENMPLSPNGKVDRRALPIPDSSPENLEVNFVVPRTETEKLIVSIVSEVLKLDQVGIYDNFFELGGHSLLATQTISRLRQAFDVDISLRSLFEFPTIADLANIIEALKGKDKDKGVQSPAITKVSREARRMKLTQ